MENLITRRRRRRRRRTTTTTTTTTIIIIIIITIIIATFVALGVPFPGIKISQSYMNLSTELRSKTGSKFPRSAENFSGVGKTGRLQMQDMENDAPNREIPRFQDFVLQFYSSSLRS